MSNSNSNHNNTAAAEAQAQQQQDEATEWRPGTPDSWDFIPSPHNLFVSINGPPPDDPLYGAWLARQAAPAPFPSAHAVLNPAAAIFVPSSAPPPVLPPAALPMTANRPKLVYTEHQRQRGPRLSTAAVIEWLCTPPADSFKEDGTVELQITFAITAVGYAHIQEGPRGRAVLQQDSPLRTEGVAAGIPAVVIAWLCGEDGLQGASVVVPRGEAEMFFVRE